MSNKIMLSALTLALMGSVHGAVVGKDKPTRFPSKAKGEEVLRESLLTAGQVLVALDDDEVVALDDAAPQWLHDDLVLGLQPAPEGFQKASKEELGAMDPVARAAYRKARRAAARDRRKAKQ